MNKNVWEKWRHTNARTKKFEPFNIHEISNWFSHSFLPFRMQIYNIVIFTYKNSIFEMSMLYAYMCTYEDKKEAYLTNRFWKSLLIKKEQWTTNDCCEFFFFNRQLLWIRVILDTFMWNKNWNDFSKSAD